MEIYNVSVPIFKNKFTKFTLHWYKVIIVGYSLRIKLTSNGLGDLAANCHLIASTISIFQIGYSKITFRLMEVKLIFIQLHHLLIVIIYIFFIWIFFDFCI